jgi:tetratricopeptide (TPR) repeat protein
MIHCPAPKWRSYPMKALRRISISVLIVLFLTVGLSYAENTAWQFLTKGAEHATQGKFEEAREKFEKSLKINPSLGYARESLKVIEDVNEGKIQTDTAIHFFKGAAHALREQWDEAITQFNKVIEAEPKYAIPYIIRGYAYQHKGQLDQAISDYNKALEINPKFISVYGNRGIVYQRKGQHEKAISDYSKAIEINLRFAEAYVGRGWAYDEKGEYDKAISDYSEAIGVNPRFALAYLNRWILARKLGRTKMACSDWKILCELGDCSNYENAKREGECE